MQLIVLGMHRSGTSAVARLLNLMGAYFAPEGTEMPCQPDNPKGFWERLDVVGLDDLVLSRARASWDRPSRFRPEVLAPQARAEFEARARPLVHRLDAHRPWMVKDPRMCLLFPLWRPLLEVPVCVLVHRHPLQIARSLRARNGLPVPVGIALWERYMTEALRAARGVPKVLVLHGDVMRDPVAAVARLHRDLERQGVGGLRLPGERELRSFLDERLYHQRADAQLAPGYLNAHQAELCALLEAGAPERLDVERPCSPGAIDTLRHHELELLVRRLLERRLDRRRARERALQGDKEALQGANQALQGENQALGERVRALDAACAELEQRGPWRAFRHALRRRRGRA